MQPAGSIDAAGQVHRSFAAKAAAQDDKRLGFAQMRWSLVTDFTDKPRHAGTDTMRPQKTYFVYILSNRSKTLYTGVTNSLLRRVHEHKLGIGSRFAAKYKLDLLVYFERFEDVSQRH